MKGGSKLVNVTFHSSRPSHYPKNHLEEAAVQIPNLLRKRTPASCQDHKFEVKVLRGRVLLREAHGLESTRSQWLKEYR